MEMSYLVFSVTILVCISSAKGIYFTNGDSLLSLSINEELPVGTYIIKAETNQPADSFDITGTAATYFAINSTGHIYIKQRIDREALSNARITGSVTATKSGFADATASFRWVINDINDNVPSYPKRLYEVTISESASIKTVIFAEKTIDGDEGRNRGVAYAIASGNEIGKFEIDINTGVLSISSQLDYESEKEYNLNITVKDGPGLANWTILVIHVIDVDDLPARFTSYAYSTSVKEDASVGARIYKVQAFDLDKGINGTVTYAIDQDSNPSRLFAINNSTGVISLNGSLDRETVNEYVIRVLALSSFPVSDHATVTVKVTDVNDNKPVFSQSTYNGTVSENMSSGRMVVQVTATDKDTGINAQLRYSIKTGDDTKRFTIDHKTGKISTAVGLDREDKDSYVLIVVVQDMDGNSSLGTVYNDTATVYIAVKDMNDNAPVFINSIYTATINESLPIGSSVIQVEAKDPDIEQDIAYIISTGNELGRFVIGRDNGIISVRTLVDRDAPNHEKEFHLQVMAFDEDNNALRSTANVTIKIEDINDNKPLCSQDNYQYSLQENATINTVVASLNCSDLDAEDNGRISYQILTGANGKFSLNTTTGSIKTSAALDYETIHTYTVQVEVKDHGQPQLSRIISVTIKLGNVNDNVPQFTKQSYEFTILEGDYAAHRVLVGKVHATDRDADSSACPCGQIRYNIVNDTGVFTIDEVTGDISSSRVFDREVKSNYTLVVKATDQDPTNPLANTSSVIIQVIDVNDNSPVFGQSSYNANVSEAATSGQDVIKVEATDRDAGSNANINYTISSGNHGNVFSINKLSGQIKVTGALDRETRNRYELIVYATDGGTSQRKTRVSVTIGILDSNDHDPVCTQNDVTVRIKENLAPGQIVTTVSITDQDKDIKEITIFSLQSDSFAVNPSTGFVNTTRSLDREEQSQYSLIVQAYYFNQSDKAVNCSVRVIVEDENDNAPIFNLSTYSLNVIENTTIGTTLLRVTATDNDVSYNGDIFYSIIGDGSKFSINSTTGTISLISTLDRETASQYTIQVIATDRGLPRSLSSTMILTINVTDINDNTPVFSERLYRGEIAENLNNTRVLDVTAHDKDDGLSGQVVYSITAGNTGNAFQILSNGTIITGTPLDREVKDRYELTVEAADRGVPAKTTSVQVIVTVLDVNDNAPNITNAPVSITIPENTFIGSLVLSLLSEDKDAGINADVTYIGYAVPAGGFAIDQSTGTIKVIGLLDREQIQSYKFHAVAIDAGNPSRNSSLIQFNITIADVNDNNPVFNPVSYMANVTEGLSPGVFVTAVNATEKDQGSSGQITYKIESGDSNGEFKINHTTGVITTVKKLDRESVAKYSMVITAMDHGNPPRVGYAYVTVQVIDANDMPPIFSLNEYYASVKEDVNIGTAVALVTAADGDLTSNAKITFSLVSGEGKADFNITMETEVQSGSQYVLFVGQISTSKLLDRESRDRYNLTVMASDGLHNVTARVIITVQDVNDNSPAFNMTGQRTNITINENTPGGTEVLRVFANDDDEGINAKITYSIQGDEGRFSIDASSGILYTSPLNLDREVKDFYNLTITAADPGNNKASISITIHVLDVNDNVPKFNQSTYTVNVGEGSLVFDVIATDNDLGANQEIRYSIVQGNEDGLFQIDNTTGRLTSTRPLDREGFGVRLDQNGRAVYLLVVKAADQGIPHLHSTANVVIRVSDINDNSPVFDQSSYSFTAAENISLGYIVGRVVAKDKDYGENANIEYSIISQDMPFSINSSSGVIKVNSSLDRENVSSYQVAIKASDKGSPSQSSTVKVTITIADVNDNRPMFNQSVYHVIIPENTRGGHVIIVLKAKDDDEGKNAEFRFAMVDGNTDKFPISELSGAIRTIGILDYETSQSYILNVSVTDRGNPPLQSFALVYINITDVNDNIPVFNESNSVVNVAEDVGLNHTVATVKATDIDSGDYGKVSYSLADDGDGTFAINKDNGKIINLKQLDYETRAVYKLHVKATDGGTNPLSSTFILTVNIVDVNDNAPQFLQDFYFTVSQDAVSGRMIGSVQARDRDSGVYGRLKYILNNRNDLFSIHGENGDISLADSVSALANQNLTLSVTCQDGGSPPLSANGTVSVYIGEGLRYTTRLVPRHINVSIYENETLGYLVATLNASNLHNIEYQLLEENYGKFMLNSSTGKITLVSSLDRETQATFKIFVAVRDRSERVNSDYGTVTVTVLDINDNPPTFIQTPNVLPISENSPNGTFVARVQATDQDDGINQQIIYYIEGEASRTFSINNITGVITTMSSLDFESNPIYNMTVIAENSLSLVRLRSSISFTIPIKDVLDFIPRFTSSAYRTSAPEDIALGSEVIDLNATTHDQYSMYVVYRIVHNESSQDSYYFSIDPESGKIRTQNSLDRETTSNYTLSIEARDIRDPAVYKASTTVIVTVTDVNDNAPVFKNKTIRFNPRESMGVGDVIGRVQAIDLDDEENAGTVYEIISGNSLGYCGINETTGDLYIVKSLDYESVSSITLTVRAYDKQRARRIRRNANTPPYDDVTVTISIQDVNDNPPVFEPPLIIGNFYPEDPESKVVATVKATDKDSNSAIKYSIFNQSHPGTLILNTQTGHVTRVKSNALLHVNTYTMAVTARDNDGVVPYNDATNAATAVIFQLTANTSLTLTVGLPISLVRQNQHLLISALKNITGKEVILKSLQKSPEDPSTTLAVIHLTDTETRTVLSEDQANSIFTNKETEIDERFPEWNIKVRSSLEPPQVSARTAYFSAYIGALIALAALIGIVGLCAILVVCRYKYREKHIDVFEPDERHGSMSEIPWTAIHYPQIGAYIESRADNPRRLRARIRGNAYQPNGNIEDTVTEEDTEPRYSAPPTNDRLLLDNYGQTITSILQRRGDENSQMNSTSNTNDIKLTNLEDDYATVNLGFEETSESWEIPKHSTKPKSKDDLEGFQERRASRSLNPLSILNKSSTFTPGSRNQTTTVKDRQLKKSKPLKSEERPAMFSPTSYSPRDHANKVNNNSDMVSSPSNQSMSYDVYDAHRRLNREDSNARRARVRFDLKDRTAGADDIEWEPQVSNPDRMPDILNSAYNFQHRGKKESKTDILSPESSVTDGEQCEVWDLEDDIGYMPLHEENTNNYDVNPRDPARTKNLDYDVQVTSL